MNLSLGVLQALVPDSDDLTLYSDQLAFSLGWPLHQQVRFFFDGRTTAEPIPAAGEEDPVIWSPEEHGEWQQFWAQIRHIATLRQHRAVWLDWAFVLERLQWVVPSGGTDWVIPVIENLKPEEAATLWVALHAQPMEVQRRLERLGWGVWYLNRAGRKKTRERIMAMSGPVPEGYKAAYALEDDE